MRYRLLGFLFAFAALAMPAHAAPVELRVLTLNAWYGGEQVDIETLGTAIRATNADIVGLQEVDGNLARIAQLAGYPHVDERRRFLSRYPLFDSGVGRRLTQGAAPYSITGLDPDAVHTWVMVRPGKVIAVANTHLSSDPSGMEVAGKGGAPSEAIAAEAVRVAEVEALAGLGKLAASRIPVVLTGDFNAVSHLDWTPAAAAARKVPYALDWPVSRMLEKYGLKDSYRTAHPDPLKKPGFTWTPRVLDTAEEMMGRIDFVLVGGPVEVLGSKVLGEANGPDVDIAVMPWPSDHRGIVSHIKVDPVPAPALISASPRRVVSGESVLIRAYDPKGEWSVAIVRRRETRPIVSLQNIVQAHRDAVRFSTLDMSPGEHDAILIGKDGKPAARAAFTVVATGARSMLRAKQEVAAGEPLSLRWENTPGAARDWIGLYAADETNLDAYQAFAYTEAAVNGAGEIDTNGLAPGAYEARLLHDEGFELLAKTRFTITSR